jgi:hypothetical protein
LLSRNPDTGEVNLKITPVNGNKVLYELGHNLPSSASMDVAKTGGGYSRFSTSDMCVTFACIDSRGEHDQGSVYVWENTLQLKHEVIQQGDKWRVELKAVPGGAEIRYTTDGSDPGSWAFVTTVHLKFRRPVDLYRQSPAKMAFNRGWKKSIWINIVIKKS